MSRWSLWSVALLFLAFVAARGAAQDKKDAAPKDVAKKDADKKDADKKDADKKDAAKKDADKADKKDADKKDADKKPDPKMPAPDKKDAEKKLLKTQMVAGELVHIEPNKQAFRVKVSYQYSEINQGAYQGMINAQRELAAARDYNARNAALRNYATNQAKLYDIKTASKEIAIDGGENMKVRLNQPKAGFDDFGNLKKFTMKELKAMMGVDKMYDGEFSDLTVGQIVQATVVVPKAPAKPVKKDDLTLMEDPKIEATRVAVLRQPAPPK